jgi:hypothetical protein
VRPAAKFFDGQFDFLQSKRQLPNGISGSTIIAHDEKILGDAGQSSNVIETLGGIFSRSRSSFGIVLRFRETVRGERGDFHVSSSLRSTAASASTRLTK